MKYQEKAFHSEPRRQGGGEEEFRNICWFGEMSCASHLLLWYDAPRQIWSSWHGPEVSVERSWITPMNWNIWNASNLVNNIIVHPPSVSVFLSEQAFPSEEALFDVLYKTSLTCCIPMDRHHRKQTPLIWRSQASITSLWHVSVWYGAWIRWSSTSTLPR
jgi:hypothetical protein